MSSNSETQQAVVPRLDKKKRCVSRDNLLKQAEKLMDEVAANKALLEIHYKDEVRVERWWRWVKKIRSMDHVASLFRLGLVWAQPWSSMLLSPKSCSALTSCCFGEMFALFLVTPPWETPPPTSTSTVPQDSSRPPLGPPLTPASWRMSVPSSSSLGNLWLRPSWTPGW